MAMICWVKPAGILVELALKDIESSVAGETLSDTELLKPLLLCAVMVADPVETPVATPEVLTVMTAGFELVHVTEFVRLLVVPSVKLPLALS